MPPPVRRYLIRKVILFIRLITLEDKCFLQRGLCKKIFLFGRNNVFHLVVGLDGKKGQAFARAIDFLGSIFFHIFKSMDTISRGDNSSRSRFFPFKIELPL